MLALSEINPYIRVAMHSILPAKSEIKMRIIYDYELIYVEDGEFVLNYDGVDYKCQTGQFIFLRPAVPHSFSNIENDLSQPHIHFDITHLENSARVPVCFKNLDAMNDKEKSLIREDVFKGFHKNPLVTFKKKSRALKCFYKAIDTNESSKLSGKARLIDVLEMLINDNFSGAFSQEVDTYSVEKQVKDFIDAGQGFGVSLDDIAKQFNYSKHYLERRFKKKYGEGIMAYRNKRRLQIAKEMLKTSSVSSVSDALYFSSIYSFSRAFKTHFGFSPTEAKKP